MKRQVKSFLYIFKFYFVTDLFIEHSYQKMCLLCDDVHLIKSVRNNLLNYKRFIFPAFG